MISRRVPLISGAPLLLIAPALTAAVLTGSSPTAMSVDTDRDQIRLVNTLHAPLPLKPRGDQTDPNTTAEDAWGPIGGGPGAYGRFGSGMPADVIRQMCWDNGESYAQTSGPGADHRVETCVGHSYTDYYSDGFYSHTEGDNGDICSTRPGCVS